MNKPFILAQLFSDHMIFQANKPIRIFGSCEKNIMISISFLDKIYHFPTKDASFVFELDSFDYLEHPFTFTVFTDTYAVSIHDCLIGEVLIASGQSNMQFLVKDCKNVPIKENPLIRFYEVAKLPFENANVEFPYFYFSNEKWYPCVQSAINEFSTIGYNIARQLYEELHIPIGVISCNMGDTSIFSWADNLELDRHPELKAFMDQYRQELAKYPTNEAYIERYNFQLPRLMNFYGEIEKGVREGLPADESHRQAYEKVPDPYIPMGPRHHNRPSGCFDMMVRKILPFHSRAVMFYQGESNHQEVEIYSIGFQSMIDSWRKAFMDQSLPFFYVQIAGYSYPGVDSLRIALLREAQEKCENPDDQVYMVSAADCGELDNIHPKDKQVVSKRLGDMILENVFSRIKNATSPKAVLSGYEGGEVWISTADYPFCLISLSGHNQGFTSSQDGKTFTKIENVKIVGSNISFHVPSNTVEIRYAYESYPLMDIYSENKWPLLPFRFFLK